MGSPGCARNAWRKQQPFLFEKYPIKKLPFFGSYSREEQSVSSDLDILDEFYKPIGIEFIDLTHELEDILQMKVDLVSKHGIKPKYFKEIERDLIYV